MQRNQNTTGWKHVKPTWDWGSQSHKHHGGHGVPQPHSAAKVGRQVTNDGGEETDNTDGHDEAGPAVPVLCGWDAGKQNLPEDGEEMHEVVVTGRQTFFTPFLIIITVTWRREKS